MNIPKYTKISQNFPISVTRHYRLHTSGPWRGLLQQDGVPRNRVVRHRLLDHMYGLLHSQDFRRRRRKAPGPSAPHHRGRSQLRLGHLLLHVFRR